MVACYGKWYSMLQNCDLNNKDTGIKYVDKELEEIILR